MATPLIKTQKDNEKHNIFNNYQNRKYNNLIN